MNTVKKQLRFIRNKYFIILQTFWFVFSVQAATLQQCSDALVAVETQQLNFGDYIGESSGQIKVTRKGVRTTTAPVLMGGTVSGGEFNVFSTRNGCRRFAVEVTFSPTEPFLNGSNGGTTQIIKIRPKNKKIITISNKANRVKANNNQSAGSYSGNFSVDFSY